MVLENHLAGHIREEMKYLTVLSEISLDLEQAGDRGFQTNDGAV